MNPIVGNGPGLIQKMAAKGDPRYERLVGLENQYASILADGGILSSIFFIGYIAGLMMLLIKVYLRSRNKELEKDTLLVLTLFIYLLINGFATSNLLGGPIIDVAMIVLAGTIAQYDRESVA
jgi:hypothetical protein